MNKYSQTSNSKEPSYRECVLQNGLMIRYQNTLLIRFRTCSSNSRTLTWHTAEGRLSVLEKAPRGAAVQPRAAQPRQHRPPKATPVWLRSIADKPTRALPSRNKSAYRCGCSRMRAQGETKSAWCCGDPASDLLLLPPTRLLVATAQRRAR